MTLKTSRLLHMADLHLGRIVSLEQFYELQSKIFNLCVDLIVIAGDLFDNHRLKDEFIEESIGILMNLGPPVVILPGNHDCYDGDSPFKRDNIVAESQRPSACVEFKRGTGEVKKPQFTVEQLKAMLAEAESTPVVLEVEPAKRGRPKNPVPEVQDNA